MIRFSDYSGILEQPGQRITCGLYLGRAALLLVAGLVFQGEELSAFYVILGVIGMAYVLEMVLDRSKGRAGITPGYLWVELVILMLLPLISWFVWAYATVTTGQAFDFGFAVDYAWALYRSVFEGAPGLESIYLVLTVGALTAMMVLNRRAPSNFPKVDTRDHRR